jgi:hypothetical protein
MKTINEVLEAAKSNSVSLEEICAVYDGSWINGQFCFATRSQQRELEKYCEKVFMFDLFWHMI